MTAAQLAQYRSERATAKAQWDAMPPPQRAATLSSAAFIGDIRQQQMLKGLQNGRRSDFAGVSPMRSSLGNPWSRLSISNLEDLSEAVQGAGLSATQMSRAPVTGSLGFMESGEVRCTTGLIGSKVSLTGPLSIDRVTLGIGLDLPTGAWHWLQDATSGDVGVFMPGDEHDSLYMPGSLYAVVTMTEERLEEVAAKHEMVLSSRLLGGSGFFGRRLPAPQLTRLRHLFQRVHSGHASGDDAHKCLLDTLVTHVGRRPRASIGIRDPGSYARIVRRARAFIHENLNRLLSVEVIAHAAVTSPRTLHRAFRIVLDETPYSYVLKLRLHRIRREVIADAEAASTLASIANHWGVSELGRFSGWYRDLFGELPSQTRKKPRETPPLFLES